MKITIKDYKKVIKEFSSVDEAEEWIFEGLAGTEGAERDHYVSMLLQLRMGNTILQYND